MYQTEKSARALSAVSFACGILGFACLAIVVCVRGTGLWCIAGCVAFSVTGVVLGAVSAKKPGCVKPLCVTAIIISVVTLVLLLILVMLIAALFIFFADFINAISGLGSMG